MNVEGFILAGGASSRMGTDKSRLSFGGQNAIDRLAGQLASFATRVSLVGSRNTGDPNSLRLVADIHPNWGALGGIQAALNSAETDWAAVVACDLPFVTRELFSRLWSLGDCERRDSFAAVVPVQADGRPQPLCALYRRAPCSRIVDELIAADKHTPRALLARVATRWVQPEELSDLPNAENFFFNVNTPADYRRAEEILAHSDR